MIVNVDKARWTMDESGQWVSFRTDQARAIASEVQEGKTYSLYLKQYHPKRTLTQNAYLWALCEEISKALAKDHAVVSKDEVYRKHVKYAGKSSMLICSKKAVDSLLAGWSSHGTGWFGEIVDQCDGNRLVRLYYGSSSYDTAEMTRLLDSVIQECDDIGVEHMSLQEAMLLAQ